MAFNKCKYCGGKNISFERDNWYTKPSFCVVCGTCNNSTEKYVTKDAAFAAWNKENKSEKRK